MAGAGTASMKWLFAPMCLIWLTAAVLANAAPQTPQTSAAATARYTLGPRDRVKITVFDEPELTNSYTVDGDGFISFPLIGRVGASGLSVGELQDRLRSMLAAGYIRNPEVRVEVDQF